MGMRTSLSIYDAIAALYDRARPSYPPALLDDICAYARLGHDARLLEIGAGTGQATVPMARRGCSIDAIELGAKLAAFTRAKLAGCPKVRVIQGDFARLDLRHGHYDLVYAATSFHWLDQAAAFRKAHQLLKPAGALALFWHRPVMTERSSQLVEALQSVYQRAAPVLTRDFEMPPQPAAVSTDYKRLIPASGRFRDLEVRRHHVINEYSADAYLELLSTFSDHIKLPNSQRQRLYAEIRALIKADFDGRALRETVALLYLARRK